MTIIEINGTDYHAFTDWDEISLKRFVRLCNEPMPEKLFELFRQIHDPEGYSKAFDAISVDESIHELPEYFGKVIEILSDIPADLIELIQAEEREALYYRLFHPIALSSVQNYPIIRDHSGSLVSYTPEDAETIEFKGEVYQLPKSLRISDIEIPMADEPIITFTEASDVVNTWRKMSERGAETVSLIAGIYLRKDGEVYDQARAMARAKEFEDMPMSDYWRLFFCISGRLKQLVKDTPSSLERLVMQKSRRLQIAPGLIRLEVGG